MDQNEKRELTDSIFKVKKSNKAVPCVLLCKGNSARLYIDRKEHNLKRTVRHASKKIPGQRRVSGNCVFDQGRFVFNFEDPAPGNSRNLIMKLLHDAQINAKVAVASQNEPAPPV